MDLRIEKTYRALTTAFTALLDRCRYEDITVAMLCDEAMIRRTTFYKHFAGKNEFFAFFVDSMRMDLVRQSEGTVDMDPQGLQGLPLQKRIALGHEEGRAIMRSLVEFMLEHERMMNNLYKSSMASMMMEVICDKISVSIMERCGSFVERQCVSDVPFEMAAQFASGGVARLLEKWWERGHAADEVEGLVERTDTLVWRVLMA